VTIADFGLVSATLCLEAIGFALDPFPLVSQWYSKFKKDFPELWAEVEPGMKEIQEFNKNPPDLSSLNHPLHPTRKQ
jgi:glutathione S-transferase